MLTGIFSTLLLPETMGRTLEELSNEDQEGFVHGMIYPSRLDPAHSVIYSFP
jgi:PHS family inorganic phosphate transporter-like MFS transporter